MKICLVTAFPPSRRGLNEYGYHIARQLQNDTLPRLTVLADEIEEGGRNDLEGFHEPGSRFPRVPAGVPSPSALFRAALPRWEAWM